MRPLLASPLLTLSLALSCASVLSLGPLRTLGEVTSLSGAGRSLGPLCDLRTLGSLADPGGEGAMCPWELLLLVVGGEADLTGLGGVGQTDRPASAPRLITALLSLRFALLLLGDMPTDGG